MNSSNRLTLGVASVFALTPQAVSIPNLKLGLVHVCPDAT